MVFVPTQVASACKCYVINGAALVITLYEVITERRFNASQIGVRKSLVSGIKSIVSGINFLVS